MLSTKSDGIDARGETWVKVLIGIVLLTCGIVEGYHGQIELKLLTQPCLDLTVLKKDWIPLPRWRFMWVYIYWIGAYARSSIEASHFSQVNMQKNNLEQSISTSGLMVCYKVSGIGDWHLDWEGMPMGQKIIQKTRSGFKSLLFFCPNKGPNSKLCVVLLTHLIHHQECRLSVRFKKYITVHPSEYNLRQSSKDSLALTTL